jgi:hypothetical protein
MQETPQIVDNKPTIVIDTNQVTDAMEVLNWLENAFTMPKAQEKVYLFTEPTLHKKVSMLCHKDGTNKKIAEIMFWDEDLNPIQYMTAKMPASSESLTRSILMEEPVGILTWPDPQGWGNSITDSLVFDRAIDLKLLSILCSEE